MHENVFLDKTRPPTPAMVTRALGARARDLTELKAHLPTGVADVWKHYGKTNGWSLKWLLGKRNLCFVTVCKGYFTVSFVFGEKAVDAVKESSVSGDVVERLTRARKYAEGRGVTLEIRSRRAVADAKTLLDIKQEN